MIACIPWFRILASDFFCFCGWYSRAHGGFVVLLCAYGFRDPGPALPWGRPHFGTHTICKSGGHTTQRMALWLYFLYEICGELLESYSFSWVVLTSPWGLRGPALCIWFLRSWSSSALGEATHTHMAARRIRQLVLSTALAQQY